MSIEDIGTDDPNLIDPIWARKQLIKNAIVDAQAKAGALILATKGFRAMINPKNKEAIRQVFDQAKKNTLQKAGVLDENFNVIPGQEDFLI